MAMIETEIGDALDIHATKAVTGAATMTEIEPAPMTVIGATIVTATVIATA